jgi:hypothetical protein
MRMKAAAVIFVGLFALASARSVSADPVQTINPAAISGPGTVLIDFEDLAGAAGEITDWYSALGLTISGGLHVLEPSEVPPGFFPAGYGIAAGTNGGATPPPDITFHLATGRAFGFDIFTIGPSVTTFTITTFAGGVATTYPGITFGTGGEPGFIGVVELDPTKWFDTVVVSSQSESSSTTAFAIDNIRMRVPEPGSLSLLGIGFALVGGASRSRRNRK